MSLIHLFLNLCCFNCSKAVVFCNPPLFHFISFLKDILHMLKPSRFFQDVLNDDNLKLDSMFEISFASDIARVSDGHCNNN